jgi:hypothetical protein
LEHSSGVVPENNTNDTIMAYQSLIVRQEEMIKKLQNAVKLLLNEKTEKKLKRPNEGFYKEYV